MSNYNSTNTKVLATYQQDEKNKRMLLLHECDSGRLQYIVGSYFAEQAVELGDTDFETGFAEVGVEYSWDWGHYFSSVVDAVDYWKRNVLCIESHEPERFLCPACSGVYQEHPVELDYSDGSWTCPECGCSTSFPEEDACPRV